MAFIPEELIEENNKLVEMICASDEGLTPAAFIEKYASEAYKAFTKQQEEERLKNLKNGIIIN